MNKEGPYRDQAERLRKKVDRNRDPAEENTTEKESLPPRSRLHRQKTKKNKWKVKYPVIRLLALLFILLPVTIFSAYNYLQKLGTESSEKASSQNGFETIGFEEKKEEKGTIIKEKETVTEKEKQAKNEKQIENDVKEDEQTRIPVPKSPEVNNPEDKGSATTKNEEQQEKNNQSTNNSEVINHTVQPGENMFRIGLKYSIGTDNIMKANNLKTTDIQVGQVLKIPKK
ncbi:LysM peptidoglycan-binding domain-containing protein [Cytobacillus depressus]|uniref:LysM peptidoglycan-binding domain-containing protein n=1 Tax=Cytobacillus depressus TaxID=1602942 RepID=A0A6L3VGI3_9BACI|nr:LysM peptidoglycan-binding domain-containing protein [Cytobacillus depressus]KAB2338355.1 LysM peptidoglycan-binding domain-containing protein [Cytobacillus depressus]